MAAIKDVATLAGVSVAAVSKYLKTPNNMREDTRQRIAQAIEELNYRPNPFAQSLRTGKTNIIAIAIPELDNPYFNKIFKLLQEFCEERGYMAILLKNATVEQAKNAAGILRSGLVDGVICYNEGQANTFIMELDAGIPVVKIDPVITDDYPATVGIDLKTGIEKLCAHLEAVGVRRLGYIGPVSDASSGQKVDALKHYCAGSGLYLDPDAFLTDCYTYGGGFDCCRRLLDSGVLLPDAIVVESDMIALGVLKCLVGRGIRVPEDILLTGYDNTDISVMSNPSLTSVDIPMEDICLAALNMLCALMRGEAAESVVFRTGLKIRASTMPPD